MKLLLYKIRNSEHLTFAETLRIKVFAILMFLVFFGALTIPVSFFADFALSILILIPSTIGGFFLLSVLFIALNKVRLAMHFSILTFIGVTVYYTSGSNLIYGFFLLFITLTVLVFYQDIYAYVVYGGVMVVYGMFYIQASQDALINVGETHVTASTVLYQIVLSVFFIVFLLQFILSDSMYDRLSRQYRRIKADMLRYRLNANKYLETLEERSDKTPLYEQGDFQKAVSEIASFVNACVSKPHEGIEEAVEFYFFLHAQDIENMKKRRNLKPIIKRYLLEFSRYLIKGDSELKALYMEFLTQLKRGYDDEENRYVFNINNWFDQRSDKLLALAILYRYLRAEPTQPDKWGRIANTMSHEAVTALFQTKAFRQFITFEDMRFYLNNTELFEKTLR